MDPKLVGQRIKSARQELGYNQSDLADLISVTQPTISRAENGDLDLSLKSLMRLADALKKPIAYLLGLDTELRLDQLEILALYDSLPHDIARRYARNVLRGLLAPLNEE